MSGQPSTGLSRPAGAGSYDAQKSTQRNPGRAAPRSPRIGLPATNGPVACSSRQPRASPWPERHELGDRQVAVGLVEQRRVADDGATRMRDQDDFVAALAAHPADRVRESRADDRRLDGVVQQHWKVAERADELGIQAGQLGPIPDGLDRHRPERRIDRQGGHAGECGRAAQEPPDRLVLPDPIEPVDPPPAPTGRGAQLGDLGRGFGRPRAVGCSATIAASRFARASSRRP